MYKIGKQNCNINFVDPDFCPHLHDEKHGTIHGATVWGKDIDIYINNKLSQREQLETLVHEIMHARFRDKFRANSSVEEEVLVDFLAHGITNVLIQFGLHLNGKPTKRRQRRN